MLMRNQKIWALDICTHGASSDLFTLIAVPSPYQKLSHSCPFRLLPIDPCYEVILRLTFGFFRASMHVY